MAVDFADVTDVAIPEGDVERITETVTGNVLWEKNTLCFEPVGDCTENIALSPYAVFDDGSKLVLFSPEIRNSINGEVELFPSWLTYTPSNNNVSNRKNFTAIDSLECIGMHPTTKKWIAFSSSTQGDIEKSDGTVSFICKRDGTKLTWNDNINIGYFFNPHCCWVSHLNKFCVVSSTGMYGGLFSVLVDGDGYYTDRLENVDIKSVLFYSGGSIGHSQEMCYSPTLRKLLIINPVYNSSSKYYYCEILTSTDGLNWTKNNNLSLTSEIPYHNSVVWIDSFNIFLAFNYSNKKMYQSTNGITWTEKTTPIGFQVGAWSPTRKIFCGVNTQSSEKQGKAYVTEDFVHWTKVRFHIPDGISRLGTNNIHLIWSPTANAFIFSARRTGVLFYKLEID